ncbi:hypothetical protein ACFYE9_23835 [Rhizobium leguminosarum]|uniref:hypothetical protein n=1 Tax=Rhizobium leguminosarum TaxID=384 RepID=UPI0036DDBDAF
MTPEIESFLGALGSLDEQLAHSTFNYVSVVIGGRQYLLQGRLFFNGFPPTEQFISFNHGAVCVGQIPFKQIGSKTRELIAELLNGYLPIAGGLHFSIHHNEIDYQPQHPAGGTVNRISVLSILGAKRSELVTTEFLDWEVRGAERPYDTIQELLSENRLGFTGPNVSFEIILNHVAEIDHSSIVTGDKAKIGLIMPRDLPQDQASIGYRVFEKQLVVARSRIHSSDMTWTETEKTPCRLRRSPGS